MFIGHFGVGFAAKPFAPRVSLGTLFLAAQFIDLLWPTLLLLGIERVAIAPGATVVTPLDFQYYPATNSGTSTSSVKGSEFHKPRPIRVSPNGANGRSGRCTRASSSQWLMTSSASSSASRRAPRKAR